MLLGAFACAILGVVIMIVSGKSLESMSHDGLPLYAWLTLTGIAGTWTVLAASKYWEGSSETHANHHSFQQKFNRTSHANQILQ